MRERFVRRCNVCGAIMLAGFCVDDGNEYYCSGECLHKVYSEEEYLAMYDDDIAYYTEWWDSREDLENACFEIIRGDMQYIGVSDEDLWEMTVSASDEDLWTFFDDYEGAF